MFTHRAHYIGSLLTLIVAVGILSIVSSIPHTGFASASGGGGGGSTSTSTPEYEFLFEKAISDNKYPDSYTADQFSFQVIGTDVDTTVSLTAGTDTYATGQINLPAGAYTVTEIGPDDFDEADWTVQWSGHGCTNGNGSVFSTAMTVTDDVSGNVCRADNQFRGEPEPVLGCTDAGAVNYDPAAEEDDESCEYDDNGGGGNGGDDGTLIIVKHVINDNNGTSTPDMFSFAVNGTGTTTFDGSGTTTLDVAAGSYTITEIAASGYDVSYDNCTEIEVVADETTICTVTNNDFDGSNGGGGHDDKKYKVYGYVWNDADENDEKNDSEGFREAGILITATNGTTTATTTTDGNGAYSFELPEGTWVLSQDKGDNWEYTFPNTDSRTHTITVPEESEEEEEDLQVSSLWGTVWNFVFPTAHAAEIEEYGPYNFGNVQHSGGGDSTSSGSSGSSGGSSGSGGSVKPVAEVAGTQTEILPQGGAFAGGGGAALGMPLYGFLFLALALLLGAAGARLVAVKA